VVFDSQGASIGVNVDMGEMDEGEDRCVVWAITQPANRYGKTLREQALSAIGWKAQSNCPQPTHPNSHEAVLPVGSSSLPLGVR